MATHSGNMNSRPGFTSYLLGDLKHIASPLIFSFPTCTMIDWVSSDDLPALFTHCVWSHFWSSHMWGGDHGILTGEACPEASFQISMTNISAWLLQSFLSHSWGKMFLREWLPINSWLCLAVKLIAAIFIADQKDTHALDTVWCWLKVIICLEICLPFPSYLLSNFNSIESDP